MIDFNYTSDVLMWATVWSALGLAGRQLLAQADQRRERRRDEHGRVAR